MLGVADDVGRDRQEQMRDFVVVEIFSDREIGVAPERAEDEGDPLLLDKAARLLDRVRRV